MGTVEKDIGNAFFLKGLYILTYVYNNSKSENQI